MRTCMACFMLVAFSVASAKEQSVAAPKLLMAEDLPTAVELDALQRQYDALLGMSLERVEYSPHGPIRHIEGDTGLVLSADAADRQKGDSAADILLMLKDLLLATGTESLSVRDNSIVHSSERALNLAESIQGIPVVNGGVSIGYNELTKRVSSVTARFVPDRALPRAPNLSAQQAEQVVLQALEIAENAKVHIRDGAFLAYYVDVADPSPPQLVWALHVVFPIGDEELFFVNAVTGIVAAREPWTTALTRKVYDVANTTPVIPQDLPNPWSLPQIIGR